MIFIKCAYCRQGQQSLEEKLGNYTTYKAFKNRGSFFMSAIRGGN